MYNKYMNDKEINVKIGDRVKLTGGITGTVIKVYKGNDKTWNGSFYEDVPETEYTQVKVHLDDIAVNQVGTQYQDGIYGGFWII